ncbi:uncharacterized protein NECHADRAFT_82982 [Fusarium vanettenii 77-13-4]|uniref:F-box domain-containing protein n=1 Tax=Fusarium vanettenii (strain ATCC MYA-4622 / CBS 123669 / FGSC 9596 / NRRL 45880 / 77-13-4) TaxID=660122 RepID=C7ZAU1_FUSV7|nr:uncharacterized protein NECHADRAFT_82982 [Fusarium vanettenii 77-13-4]EEU38633.1 hypothetical protein NECHADRAFT_82982 [Fusarium vanettenii 77-13-4]
MESLLETPRTGAGVSKNATQALEQTTCDANHAGSTNFESLLPELQFQILCLLDLHQLRAVIHASPSFHRQYRHDRKYILRKSLEQTLGSVIVDAYAVLLLATQSPKPGRLDFLQWYSKVTKARRLPHSDDITEAAAIDMAIFFFRLADPVAEYYAYETLSCLSRNLEKHSFHRKSGHVLSSSETMRFRRAIYRFQLLSLLVDLSDTSIELLRTQIAQDFINMLEPWETEEAFAFYQYLQSTYHKVFADISWDLNPKNPKSNGRGQRFISRGSYELDQGWLRCDYVEGTALAGLSPLEVIFFHRVDRELVVSTMERHMRKSHISLGMVAGIFGHLKQAKWRLSHPSERDRMRQEKTPFPFRGDGEPDAPPLGWTIIWGGVYCNLYGWHIPQEIRRWGFVFWDAIRMEETRAVEMLRVQWEEDAR